MFIIRLYLYIIELILIFEKWIELFIFDSKAEIWRPEHVQFKLG